MSGVQLNGGGGRYALTGELSFATVDAATPAPVFTADAITVDLSGVDKTDSAGLALLLDWQRRATAAGGRLQLVNPPERLQSLTRVYGLSDILAV